VIRIAASADLHFGTDSEGMFRPHLEEMADRADVLLLAGDLTKRGDPEEAAVLADELADAPIPVVAVLGNHDYHSDEQDKVRRLLQEAGVTVLDGESTVLQVDGSRLGIVGAKGFGGGFVGASATDFGEPEMKAFVRHTKDIAGRVERLLGELDANARVVLLHYSPIKETLYGEPPEIYAFLGSYLLAEAIDRAGADLVLHGHAHRGVEKGVTPGGVHVRNVAQHVIRSAYNVYIIGNGNAVSRDDDAELQPA
jgi:Icc-related predicted phosphoesterase